MFCRKLHFYMNMIDNQDEMTNFLLPVDRLRPSRGQPKGDRESHFQMRRFTKNIIQDRDRDCS